ncbi:MAG TPA: hypothetical protein GYA08_15525 [Chloroflexi bacterium]|nr:hypothetical protein [Chloroflexota bacterium]
MLEWEYHLERQRDLLREVERERLAQEAQRAEQPRNTLAATMALAAGRGMMRLGAWLEAFGKPASNYADEIG